jgi:hypothetical protein
MTRISIAHLASCAIDFGQSESCNENFQVQLVWYQRLTAGKILVYKLIMRLGGLQKAR